MSEKPGFGKQAAQGIGMAVIVVAAFLAGGYFFKEDPRAPRTEPMERSIDGVTLPNGVTLSTSNPGAKKPEGSGITVTPMEKPGAPVAETASAPASAPEAGKAGYEGSGGATKDHPVLADGEAIKREIMVPEDIKGKWKAVKLLIKNKKDEEKNEFKTVELGSSFQVEGTGLKVTVGPFFPNFVMNELYYTSMNNQLLNPAVHLVVEENGKKIYDGWSFTRYPDLYAFDHPAFGIRLTDYISAEVS